jgi:ribulose-phosphate 3-epimerase
MIIPSIIAKNQKELTERLAKVKDHVKLVQLDVMDGKFVKNKSLMFKLKLDSKLKYEAHLMVKKPLSWIKKNLRKVDLIVVHYEIDNVGEVVNYVKSKRKKVGVAINPKTKVKEIKDYLSKLDQVIVMTVTPGKYGRKFLPKMLRKIKELKKLKPGLKIEVDGSVNLKTIKKIRKAGADKFVVGSYLQKSENVKEALRELKR